MAEFSDVLIDATSFGVAATLVYDVFSATNSSPQTTELFAKDRADTLWKYVRLGAVQSLFLVLVMWWRSKSVWPILGGLTAGLFMWAMYAHALRAGGGAVKSTHNHNRETMMYGCY